MERYELIGVNQLDEPARINADVCRFTGCKDYFTVSTPEKGAVKLTTRKGTYVLRKNPSQNIYAGVCAGHKVHVSLKKIKGEIRFW